LIAGTANGEPLIVEQLANFPNQQDFMMLVVATVSAPFHRPQLGKFLWSGRRFRTFNVIDEYNREGLRIEIDTSLTAARVIRALNELVEVRGAPLSIRLDNGPEFIAHALAEWAQSKGIALNHIQPGKPTQNAYVERFNKTYRTEVLDCYVFDSLHEVRQMTEDWLHRYNHHRPHESLGRIPPVEYRVKQFPNLYF